MAELDLARYEGALVIGSANVEGLVVLAACYGTRGKGTSRRVHPDDAAKLVFGCRRRRCADRRICEFSLLVIKGLLKGLLKPA
jgi:hypothetical protein